MGSTGSFTRGNSQADREFFLGLGRAFAGALIFSLPMLMTMEVWSLGFYMSSWRLALLLVVTVPLLVGLSRYGGFKATERLVDDVVDAFVAFLLATLMALIVLGVFGLLTFEMSAREIIGKIILQAVPGSIGAMLARSQLAGEPEGVQQERRENPAYWGEIFLMAVGALFLSFNVAPTEEMILIAYNMSVWQEIALAILSLLLMHSFVYVVNFRGGTRPATAGSIFGAFARFTVVGYAVVLLVSFYILWTFGRVDGTALEEVISTTVVLGFPGAIGAAAARLVL